MDCNSARLFLQFRQDGTRELDNPEKAELENHLAHCHECNTQALDQRRLDNHLGRAMRAVEVPRGLREQIHQRLAAERRAVYRRWAMRGMRGLAAAAAVLLVVGLWYWLYQPARPTLSADHLVSDFNVCRPDEVGSDEQLKQLGGFGVLSSGAGAPTFVEYRYLVGSPAMAILPTTRDWRTPVKVPQFVFVREGREAQRAVVFAVPVKEYDVAEMENPDHGYAYRLDVERRGGYVYLVFYTGESWEWLRRAE